ncbi:MAG: response regulator transcription factor [Campylobacterota bacterium]
MKILLLEDDFDYKESIQEFLESLGYGVDAFDNGDEAFDAIFEKTYHILLLDIRVPGMSGYDIVQSIKKENITVPVMFLTSLTDINNLSLGYELGCDDYLKKPFALKELQYRLAHLCKLYYYGQNSRLLKLGEGFFWDEEQSLLYDANQEQVGLSKHQKEVVFTLISRANTFVTMDQLKDTVWEECYINDVDVRMCIANIRKKTSKTFIQSRRGYGYKIITG